MSWFLNLSSGLGVPSWPGVLVSLCPSLARNPMRAVLPPTPFLLKDITSGVSAGRDRERFSSVTAFGENYITILNSQWAPSQGTC